MPNFDGVLIGLLLLVLLGSLPAALAIEMWVKRRREEDTREEVMAYVSEGGLTPSGARIILDSRLSERCKRRIASLATGALDDAAIKTMVRNEIDDDLDRTEALLDEVECRQIERRCEAQRQRRAKKKTHARA